MQSSPRILKEAKYQSALTANRIKNDYDRNRLSSWKDIERIHQITVPADYHSRPWNYESLSAFLFFWRNSFEARLAAATEGTKKTSTNVKIDRDVETFGTFTLKPEQQGVFEALYKDLFVDDKQAVYQDGATGVGKTIVAGAIICRLFKEGVLIAPDIAWRLHPVIIICPKGVMEHWKRVLDDMGLAELVSRRKIYVISDAELITEFGDMFAREEEDPVTGNVTMVWNPVLTPLLCIVDEGHRFNNPDSIRTRKLLSLLKAPWRKHLLFMSATPMEKINDAYTFVLSCNTTFMDMKVTDSTFKYFAGLLDATPEKPNREAVKRLRSVLSEHIRSFPYVKPKFKAVNVVRLVDFKNTADKRIYDTAHERYIEACIKCGKNTMFGRFQKAVALLNFCKTAEPLRAWYYAHTAAKDYREGKQATAVFTRFKETITETAFQLIDTYGIPREHIAIVWGGKRQYKTEDLLSKEELDAILARSAAGEIQSLLMDKALLKRVKITLKYLQDQHEHDETAEEQAYRHERLRELKLLGKQSDGARQVEVDSYQDGTARILLATIDSGGIGLSFDRNKEHLLPRHGLFSPIYSGKMFQQALGRLVRTNSLSDALQEICLMAGTVEQYHVAPILDEKLKCIAEITNRSCDFTELLSNQLPVAPAATLLRDVEQAAKDAEEDNTIVSSFHSDNEADDEEENDDNLIPV